MLRFKSLKFNFLMFFIFIVGLSLSIILLALTKLENQTVAIVGSQEITSYELENSVIIFIKSYEKLGINFTGSEGEKRLEQIRKIALEKLIEDKLFVEKSKELRISVDQAKVDFKIRETIGKFSNFDEYKKSLASVGLNEETYRKTVENNILREEVKNRLIGKINLNLEDVRAFYKKQTGIEYLPKELEKYWEDKLIEQIMKEKEEKLIKDLWKEYPPFYGGRVKKFYYKIIGKI